MKSFEKEREKVRKPQEDVMKRQETVELRTTYQKREEKLGKCTGKVRKASKGKCVEELEEHKGKVIYESEGKKTQGRGLENITKM